MSKLTLTFEVDEDLPSERRLQYRQLVIGCLELCADRIAAEGTPDEVEMLNRLLEDCYK